MTGHSARGNLLTVVAYEFLVLKKITGCNLCVRLFLLCAVVLHCVAAVFCFVSCFALRLLLFCMPKLGSCVLPFPTFPLSFLCLACLFSVLFPLFVLDSCPCSLPPSLPFVCVCVCRESKIEKGKVTKLVRWQNLHAKPVEIFFRFDSVHVALTQKVIVCMRVCVNCVQTTSYHAEESRS